MDSRTGNRDIIRGQTLLRDTKNRGAIFRWDTLHKNENNWKTGFLKVILFFVIFWNYFDESDIYLNLK